MNLGPITSPREKMQKSLVHRVAAEVHRALSDRAMTVRELSLRIGESESFINRVLTADDGVADVLKLRFLADVAWATDHEINVGSAPEPAVDMRTAVKRSLLHRS